MTIASLTRPARFGIPFSSLNKIREIVDALPGHDDHAAASPTIAAIGTAFGDVSLAPKADAAVAAIAGPHFDFHSIDEHDGSFKASSGNYEPTEMKNAMPEDRIAYCRITVFRRA
jgi:hypothetical protein